MTNPSTIQISGGRPALTPGETARTSYFFLLFLSFLAFFDFFAIMPPIPRGTWSEGDHMPRVGAR